MVALATDTAGFVELTASGRIPDALAGGIAAIGNFDGVHRGHAALVSEAVAQARRDGVPALVLTFDPHPRTFFRPQVPVFTLTPLSARVRLLRALGADAVVVATFDRTLAARSPEDFASTVLAGQLGVAGVVVGFNFKYGKERAGSAQTLGAAGVAEGFSVTVVEAQGDGVPVTSSAVRNHLSAGEIAAANRLLGYRWFVEGEVAAGHRRGRDLGYPTANIALWPDCDLRHGIYAVTATTADGRTYDGVASFGTRPTFDDGGPLLEAHLFDFDGDLYGSTLSVAFVDWLRRERKFDGADALIAAMHGDAAAARAAIAAAPAPTARDAALAATPPQERAARL